VFAIFSEGAIFNASLIQYWCVFFVLFVMVSVSQKPESGDYLMEGWLFEKGYRTSQQKTALSQ
jgi:hypothetical protein